MTSASAWGGEGEKPGGGRGTGGVGNGGEAPFVSICEGKTRKVGVQDWRFTATRIARRCFRGGFFKEGRKNERGRRMCMQRKRKHMYMDAVQSVSQRLTALCVRV